jgi:hypothetical protein
LAGWPLFNTGWPLRNSASLIFLFFIVCWSVVRWPLQTLGGRDVRHVRPWSFGRSHTYTLSLRVCMRAKVSQNGSFDPLLSAVFSRQIGL